MKYIFLLVLLISSAAQAWYPVDGYHNLKVYGIKGTLIENMGLRKANVEIIWYPKGRKFGMTFFTLADHKDEITIPNGKFIVQGCGRMVQGDLLGPQMVINKYEVTKLARLFRVCNEEITVNVVDNIGQYGTYRINGHDKLKFKELK
ncbi:hypothetical protein [Providencia phage PSTCR6]|nr:hypothetical protein [Providencia phage PSTCR6]